MQYVPLPHPFPTSDSQPCSVTAFNSQSPTKKIAKRLTFLCFASFVSILILRSSAFCQIAAVWLSAMSLEGIDPDDLRVLSKVPDFIIHHFHKVRTEVNELQFNALVQNVKCYPRDILDQIEEGGYRSAFPGT